MKVLVKGSSKRYSCKNIWNQCSLQLKVKMKLESRLHNQKQHVEKEALRTALASEKYKVQKH
jgi:hypothetical protein